MRPIFIFFALLLLVSNLNAQNIPQTLNYQAIVRDNANVVQANRNVAFRFSVLNAQSTPVYAEIHSNVLTDALGQVNLVLGTGAAQSNLPVTQFSQLDWKQVYPRIRVELDPSNGSNFINMGNIDLQSVPYANVANEALNVKRNLVQLDDVNAPNPVIGQVLKWNGSRWIADNDQQGSLNLSAGTGLSLSGGILTNTGDLSNTNEIQNLSINGNQLSISGGNTVTLPSGGGSYTAGTGININNGVISNTGDLSASNELQQLSFSGTTLSISNGNSIALPYSFYQAGTGITLANGGINTFTIQNTAPSKWTQSGNNILYNNSGRVGIGTGNNPLLAKLNVSSSAGPALDIDSPNQCIVANAGNGEAILASNISSSIAALFAQNQGSGPAIATNGNVGINVGNSPVAYDLDVRGIARVTDQIICQGDIVSGDIIPSATNSYTLGSSNFRWREIWSQTALNTSDRREKQNIQRLSYGLEQVMQLKPVIFEWINAPEKGANLGFIAQDLQAVLPEVVVDRTWEKDASGKMKATPTERLAVKNLELIPVLTKAIQEQQVMIEQLKSSIATLQSQVMQLSVDSQTAKK
jgi:hypothetical protein